MEQGIRNCFGCLVYIGSAVSDALLFEVSISSAVPRE